MNAPSLKQSLARWTGLPTLDRTFEPRMTRRAVAKVKKLLGDAEPKAPEAYDLEALHRRVMELWRRERSLAQLASRDLRRLPWILFYPPKRTDATDWLGAESVVLRQYGRWLTEGRRTRSVLALLREFLRVYPDNLPTFNELRRILQSTVESCPSPPPPPSLQRWRKPCRDFGFLEADGAEKFVQKLLSAEDTPEEVLQQAGLDAGLLARCGFLESGVRACLVHTESRLRDDGLEHVLLERLLALLTCEGRLRFDHLEARKEIATALLRPFTERRPKPETRNRLQPFFLRHFGDPRLRKDRWSGVQPEIRRVLIRWLNERALEQFFALVENTALDRHWRYREAFWRAFLPLDPDICFVLGQRAHHLRNVSAESDVPEATAILRGAQGNQSVLLLRLPGVTIAEWSHNGACRFWLDGTLGAPKLYDKLVYHRWEMMYEADFRQAHISSHTGSWQDRIMVWLRDNTGIELDRAKYFPRRLRETGWY